MAKKCPHCGGEIDYLDWLHTNRVHERYHESGEIGHVQTYDADEPDEKFECPLCDEVVATSMAEAMKFFDEEG